MSDDKAKDQINKKALTPLELSIFCEQVSMIIQSGMMIHSGIEMMAEDTKESKMKSILNHISNDLNSGLPFYEALKNTAVIPEYMVYMTKIGDESGKLDIVMKSLSSYYSREDAMRENIKSAVVYPAALIVMMLAVFVFLTTKVLPVFNNVFNSLGTEMSAGAKAIMNFGAMTSKYSLVFLLIALVIIIATLFFMKAEKGKDLFSNFLSKRKFTEAFSVASFASSMSLMLSSGLDTDHSLELSVPMVTNNSVREKIKNCIAILEDKENSFVDAIRKASIFSSTTIGVLSMGAKAGSLDTAMQYVADIYEDEFQRSMLKKVALIEPLSVAIASILIGAVLISVMLPLLGVMSSIG